MQTHKGISEGSTSESLFTTIRVVGWIQSMVLNKTMSDSQLAWHHLAQACPWHDNEGHTQTHADIKTHLCTHTISPTLLRYLWGIYKSDAFKDVGHLKQVLFIRSQWKEVALGYTTETQQDPLFILKTRMGKENTRELERDSAGGCGMNRMNILAFTSSVVLGINCLWAQKTDLNSWVKGE